MGETAKKHAPQKTLKFKLTDFKNGINSNTDEFVLPFTSAKKAYNFNFSSGALTVGLGFERLVIKNANYPGDSNEKEYPIYIPGGFYPVRGWHYKHYDINNNYARSDKLLVVGKNNDLVQYSIPSTTYSWPDDIGEIVCSSMPKQAINYRLSGRDVMIFTYENSPMQVYDASNETNKLTTITNAPNIISMCINYGRLFAVVADNRNAIYFSEELDPTAWDISLSGAGSIEMVDERGELTRVISYGGYVYIFREYGISRLTAYANNSAFNITPLFTSCGRIYQDTIAVCGNKFLFLCDDGLYSFDGTTTTKLIMNIESMFEKMNNTKSVGAYHQGRYYLGCRLNYNNDLLIGCENVPAHINNSVVSIDLKTGVLNITRGVDISFFTLFNETDKSKLICCHNSFHNLFIGAAVENTGETYGLHFPRCWLTPSTDFGYPGNIKVIKELTIISKYASTFKIISDLETKTIALKASNKIQKIKTMVKGKVFKFEFGVFAKNAYISHPEITVDVI